MNTLALPTSTEIVAPLFAEAKAIFDTILEAEMRLTNNRDELLSLAFRLGRALSSMKEEIGHGKWLTWLEGHWPQLGIRNAQRCMALFGANPQISARTKCVESTHLDDESVRKFMWSYIPAKERPELEGNRKVTEGAHYLTFVNHFAKFDRQVRVGLIPMPPVDVFRRECEPTMRRIIEIGGRDWVAGLLG